MDANTLQSRIVDRIDDVKGQDIITIDVQGKSSIADRMIICTGTSTRHVVSIAQRIIELAKEMGIAPLGMEGEKEADWVVVDLGDILVHVMQDESRRLYALEKLWS